MSPSALPEYLQHRIDKAFYQSAPANEADFGAGFIADSAAPGPATRRRGRAACRKNAAVGWKSSTNRADEIGKAEALFVSRDDWRSVCAVLLEHHAEEYEESEGGTGFDQPYVDGSDEKDEYQDPDAADDSDSDEYTEGPSTSRRRTRTTRRARSSSCLRAGFGKLGFGRRGEEERVGLEAGFRLTRWARKLCSSSRFALLGITETVSFTDSSANLATLLLETGYLTTRSEFPPANFPKKAENGVPCPRSTLAREVTGPCSCCMNFIVHGWIFGQIDVFEKLTPMRSKESFEGQISRMRIVRGLNITPMICTIPLTGLWYGTKKNTNILRANSSNSQANLTATIMDPKSAKLMDLSGEVENSSSISMICTALVNAAGRGQVEGERCTLHLP
ncbi:hypothetical protein B0H17DRAFT_1139867 [Mycena rosella]|uniref:Uncharacterized protein n=1 Tax=Mycena rosella TaxID=1033263 RepID=A0AAD7GBZ6_MYCRO|nr:hypothetical protein B0H17DRAFT_1139867 [Mycena rosella]